MTPVWISATSLECDKYMKITNVVVEARENESSDRLIRRFIKKVKSSGVIEEIRSRRCHLSNAEKKRIKEDRARVRKAKELRKKANKKTFKTVVVPKPQKEAKNED